MMAAEKTKQLQVKLSPEDKDRFRETARRYRLSLAAFARLSMEYFAENNATLPIQPQPQSSAKKSSDKKLN